MRVWTWIACAIGVATAALCGAAPAKAQSPRYELTVSLDPAAGRLAAEARISGLACTGDRLRLHLHRGLAIEAAEVDGRAVAASFDPPDAEPFFLSAARPFDLPCPKRDVRLKYEGPGALSKDGRNQVSADLVELSLYGAWYPIADISVQVWGRLETALPAGWTWASSAERQKQRGRRGEQRLSLEWSNAPDFTLIASPSFERRAVGPVDLLVSRARSPEEQARAEAIAATAAETVANLSAWMGPPARAARPTLVFTPRGGPLSYARLPLIITPERALSAAESSGRPTGLNIRHEVAHFWTRASRAPEHDWINEGLADYLALRALRVSEGSAAYDALIASYLAQSAAAQAAFSFQAPGEETILGRYFRPALLFDALERAHGEAAMTAFLAGAAQPQDYDTAELSRIAGAAFGEAAGALLERCAKATDFPADCRRLETP